MRSTRSRSPERSSGRASSNFPIAYLDEQAMRDPAALRPPPRPRRRAHQNANPAALAPDGPVPRARGRDQTTLTQPTLCAGASGAAAAPAAPACERLRIAREQLSHIRRLTRQIDALEQELEALVKAHRPWLLQETGCGPLVASVLIGRTAGAHRFRSGSAFARQAGACPIPCSSGQTQNYRLNRGGDRQLNSALHTIAASRARVDPRNQEYLARKHAEGKTKKAALRCLKRTLANHFHQLLARPPLTPDHTNPSQRETQPIHTAPNPMICLT